VVTDLAWHPSGAEILLIRQRMIAESELNLESGSEQLAPFDTLVRLNLATGEEREILTNIGPQARLIGPRFSPDGSWGYVRVECCLSRALAFFNGSPTEPMPADRFLPAELADRVEVRAGPIAADGRITMAVSCCLGDSPDEDPAGLYLVGRDLSRGEHLTGTPDLMPLGLGPNGDWLAGFRPEPTATANQEGRSLVVVSLADGSERTIWPASGLGLAERGDVAPDGTIAVASRTVATNSLSSRLGDLYTVGPDGVTRRNLTNGGFTDFTAFGWAPASVRAALAGQARVVSSVEVCAEALAGGGIRWDGLPLEPFISDGQPRDLGLIRGTPLTVCVASGPPELLPAQNAIGCVLAGGRVAKVGERLLCGAFLSIERPGDLGLVWVAHNSATTATAAGFRWNGISFELLQPPYLTCKEFPLREVQDPAQCAPP
jgi:hypothetical protein